MKTIAVINYKGGGGKTTVTANLTAYFAAAALKKYTVAQLRQIAQAFGVAAGKKKDEAIALIVNIALGDAVLAQIVGGKTAREKEA
ncbi:hypothetical protein FACS1894139_07700 [Planctomycetales bacterium]|nr:hypothetical protein FACS1894108_08960 [Planctomycetales bacterium]GHT04859.1 hypothetical protein FACS1894139_07700 [Planctomycetales bacterium]